MTDNRQPPTAPARTTLDKAKATGVGALGLAAASALAMAVAGIKPDEGYSRVTYLDIAKLPTSCWGHREPNGTRIGIIRTDGQCQALLNADVQREQNGVAACVPALQTRPYQWAASTRLAHNAGVSAFCHSSTARAFNAGQWRAGCDAMMLWDKARVGGRVVVVSGLAARRERERAQCLTGVAA